VERIAIFAALRWECQPVLRHLRRVTRERMGDFVVWRGHAAAQEVWLVKTGIGEERAGAAAELTRGAEEFALFLNTGCAGALAPELGPGDLTVATAIIGHGTATRFDTTPRRREYACRVAARAQLRTTAAPVLCSPRTLATAADKRAAASQHGAVAVEMEGAPIAACAAQAGVAFASVRAILDAVDTELRHSGRFMDEQHGTLKPLALAGYLATHPTILPDLLALQRMQRTAQTSLNKFFDAWFMPA
jgi:adenosylhomocysteine nucleosidase